MALFLMFLAGGKTENKCENDNGFGDFAKANKINGLRHWEGRFFVVKVAIVRK
jgi:hypothetical protein